MLEYSWPCTRGVCLMLTLSTHSHGTALSGFAFVWFGQILPGHQVIPINFAVCIIFFQLRPTTLHPPSSIMHPISTILVLPSCTQFCILWWFFECLEHAVQTRRRDCLFIKIRVGPRNVCSQVLHLFVRLILWLFLPARIRLFHSCLLGKFLHGVDGVGLRLLRQSCWLPQEQALYHFIFFFFLCPQSFPSPFYAHTWLCAFTVKLISTLQLLANTAQKRK